MRTLPFAFAAVLVAGAGTASAQHFTTPSQLGYPYYGQPSPAMARYMEPAPKPLPMEQSEPTAPLANGAPRSAINGAPHVSNGPCTGCTDSDGYAGCYETSCCRPTWYGSVAGLYMTRDCPDEKQIAFDPLNLEREYLGTQMVCPDDWQTGFELRIGACLGCSCRVEAVYWQLDPDERFASTAGPVDSALDFTRLDFGVLGGANDWFDNSQFQQISMRSEFQNFETNLWTDCCCGPCNPLQLSWLAGFRFFRFEEQFAYASADQAGALGVLPGADAYYNVGVENNLFGVQLGARAEYKVGCNWGVFAEPRIGIFYNHIEQQQLLVNGNGVVAIDLAGRPLDISTEKEDFATLAQLDVGVNYDFSCNLSAYVGYRLVAASGVALSTDQIPQYISDINGIKAVDSNGHLFLHGAQAGLTWRY